MSDASKNEDEEMREAKKESRRMAATQSGDAKSGSATPPAASPSGSAEGMSKAAGAPVVELHTGKYADADSVPAREEELARLQRATLHADGLGLQVNAGHGLNYHNVRQIARIKEVYELNIGHSIVARAVMIGFQRAKEIMYFAERIPAQQLFDLGLINKVLPHDQLLPYARERALKLIPPQGAGYAVRMAKRALHRPLLQAVTTALDLENKGLNEAFTTADFAEALTARVERRPPAFKGR